MNKTYKGWELLKAIAAGEIKRGSEFSLDCETNHCYFDGANLRYKNSDIEVLKMVSDRTFSEIIFELISEPAEEIDIQEIEEIYKNDAKSIGKDIEKSWTGRNLDLFFADKINQLIKAIKQLDNQIKENK